MEIFIPTQNAPLECAVAATPNSLINRAVNMYATSALSSAVAAVLSKPVDKSG